MTSPDDYENDLERRERELKRREVEMRLREMEAEVNQKEAPFYPTVKHQPEEKTQKPALSKKVVLGLKLFGLGVAALIAVRIAAFVAGVAIVALLGWISYKLFFDSPKKRV